MFRTTEIWDFTLFTRGTVIKIEGYSPMNAFEFEGLEYKVKDTKYDILVVQSKNGNRYEIGTWEVADDYADGLTITIVSQVPYMIPF